MRKVKHIVVFTERSESPEFPKTAKIEWANPYYYVQPRNKADAVYAPNNPKIEDEYIRAGKIAWRPEGEPEQTVVVDDVPEQVVEENPEVPVSEVSEETVSEVVEEEKSVEGHWSELSWPKMRSLATEFTDEPVKSKDQAKEVLEQAEAEGKI